MPGAWTTGRVEAFSDGIFSIAATLLVLELRVPDLAGSASEGDLASALWDVWPRLLTFAVSFAVIAMYWLGHYSMMHWLERADRRLLQLHVPFLLSIALLPFPTAVAGAYPEYRVAVALYGANLFLSGVTFYLIWWYAHGRGQLIYPDLPEEVSAGTKRRVVAGIIGYGVGTLAALIWPPLSIPFFAAPIVYWLMPTHLDPHVRGEHEDHE